MATGRRGLTLAPTPPSAAARPLPSAAAAGRRRAGELLDSARREVLVLQPQGFEAPPPPDRRGVSTRVVLAYGLPLYLAIVDREVAALAWEPRLTDWTRVDAPAGAVASLLAIFERYWRDAAEDTEEDAVLAPVHLHVLRLLATGMADKEIAASLGSSTRTVQRHVTTIMNVLRVRSRLELGFVWRTMSGRTAPERSAAGWTVHGRPAAGRTLDERAGPSGRAIVRARTGGPSVRP
ncbi:helix-turn-helix transcriptional regulator [Actinomadura sp. NPDC049382]|uniref:helix-turn-helix transcriptional regulator n=1 Tax=Actinomadura sp. NPDC049382 TaxID=3158220 RepID=UPI003424535A